jgi:hypothetical protein
MRTHTRRQIEAEKRKLALELEVIIQEELTALLHGMYAKVRRLNRQRIRKFEEHPKERIMKLSTISINLWDMFRQRLQNRLMAKLQAGTITLAMLANITAEPVEIDFAQFAKDYEPSLGERIKNIMQTLKRVVGKRITAWYNTPGSTMQSIYDDLKEVFGGKRAWNVAQNEIAELHGAVTERLVRTAGVEEWWVSTHQDQIVCTKPLVGPDGKTYKGCRELHGKIFKVGMKRPPFHISCRCNFVPLTRSVKHVKEVPIVDLSHLGKAVSKFDEAEHPRDKSGEFTSKGGNPKAIILKTNDLENVNKLKFVAIGKYPARGASECYVCDVKGDGKVLVKPHNYGAIAGNPNNEVMAYEFADALGFTVVPVTVYKKFIDGRKSSAQEYIEDTISGDVLLKEDIEVNDKTKNTFSEMVVLDIITNNLDRRACNWLYRKDTHEIVAIDNGFAGLTVDHTVYGVSSPEEFAKKVWDEENTNWNKIGGGIPLNINPEHIKKAENFIKSGEYKKLLIKHFPEDVARDIENYALNIGIEFLLNKVNK